MKEKETNVRIEKNLPLALFINNIFIFQMKKNQQIVSTYKRFCLQIKDIFSKINYNKPQLKIKIFVIATKTIKPLKQYKKTSLNNKHMNSSETNLIALYFYEIN